MPGVVGVFTADDIAELMPMPVVWVPKDVESHFPPHPSGMVPGGQSLLAKDRVRFVGDQLAVVVAETRQQAFDALDAITVTYEPLPVVTDAEAALKPGAPQLHDAVPNNLMLHWSTGDKAAAEGAIADAAVVDPAALRQPADDVQHGRDAGLAGAVRPEHRRLHPVVEHPADLPGAPPDQPVRPGDPVQQAAGDRADVRWQPGLEGVPVRRRPADAPPVEGPRRPPGQMDRHPGRAGPIDGAGTRSGAGRYARRHPGRHASPPCPSPLTATSAHTRSSTPPASRRC